MKKILISLSIIVAVGAAVAYGTSALFSDEEKSTGNVFTAGSIDLKVDHLAQTYNGLACNTANVTVQSDTSNVVVAKSAGATDPVAYPHPALLVNPINPAWTASISGASWIWSQNPTPLAEYGIDTTYTFEKTFNWMGPVTGATLVLNIGADNSYQVYLNNNFVGGDLTEQNYNSAGQDTITGAPISSQIVQGVNTLRFVVKNWLRPAGQTWDNPGGLLYKLVIDGNPTDDYFKDHCTLFGAKDLVAGDHFWQFNDVKPGDQGTNLISLHVDNNDANICLLSYNKDDEENVIVDPEATANDVSTPLGELSQYIKLFAWADDGDGVYETPEAQLVPANTPIGTEMVSLALSSTQTSDVGVAWCFGNQAVVGSTISCDGTGSTYNNSMTDSLTLDVVAYAIQQRNNENFTCDSILPTYRPVTNPGL